MSLSLSDLKLISLLTLHFVIIWNVKEVPIPTLLFTEREPFISSVIFLHIDNPSPVPSRFWAAFSSSLLKSIKRFLIPSSEMPPPLSMILIWKQMSASFLEGKRIDSKDFSYGLLHLLWIYYSTTLS